MVVEAAKGWLKAGVWMGTQAGNAVQTALLVASIPVSARMQDTEERDDRFVRTLSPRTSTHQEERYARSYASST
ncbi:MAG TPA: hypothetical protein VLF21_00380 [Candidatus Saccharimonadales bacterium]|nr:hypothetical protein [Candidatus Saccharimonadales bacterium]